MHHQPRGDDGAAEGEATDIGREWKGKAGKKKREKAKI